MIRLRYIHWNATEAKERAAQLEAMGNAVNYSPPEPRALVNELRADPPDAVVIDLGRTPSVGRDLAVLLRGNKATRSIPLVFVGGEAEKVARVRGLLSDAVFTTWESIGPDLAQAIANPPADPIAPKSALAGYSGTPLVKKLGIKPGMRVAAVDAPDDFAATLGPLPEGSSLVGEVDGECGLVVWFVYEIPDLLGRIDEMSHLENNPPVWVAWPKKGSPLWKDVSEPLVRETGLRAGLVDYKVCAIDQTWSGLLFTQRKR